MKKIEIITLHRVPNYGSLLQAYATQEVIGKLGYETEIVDYIPYRMTKRGMLKNIKNIYAETVSLKCNTRDLYEEIN